MIHRAAQSIIDTYFAPMEQKKKPLLAAQAFDAYFQGFSLREIQDHLANNSKVRESALKPNTNIKETKAVAELQYQVDKPSVTETYIYR